MNTIEALPKIDLHCHLDGSVRPQTIVDIATEENIELPSYEVSKISELVKVTDDNTSLDDYLTKFNLPLDVMQSEKSLERITFEVFEDAAKENVKYMEVRFAPILHTRKGLSLEKVIESVLRGLNKAENTYEIKGNLILSCLRTMPQKDSYSVIEAGKKFINRGVVAVDLAGPERENFSNDYILLINKARYYGYDVTIHAGEAGDFENVMESINLLHAHRIGHGVKIMNSIPAQQLVKEKSIYLEMCPYSNLQTKTIDDIANYPFYKFYKDGIKEIGRASCRERVCQYV